MVSQGRIPDRRINWPLLRTAFGALLALARFDSLVAAPPAGPVLDVAQTAEAAAETPPPSADQIAQWIDELGHSAYAVRQMAAERLMAAGLAARDTLSKETDSPDPETRAAARRIVALIDESETNRRLTAFAADVDGRRGLSLPGWKEFGELVGQDEAARALFVDMQRHEAPLLAEVFGSEPREGKSAWDDRLMRLMNYRPGQQMIVPPLGSCATMMFLGATPNSEANDARTNSLFALAIRPPLREALQVRREPSIVRRLVVAWIVKCPNRSEPALRDRLGLMLIYGLEEALPLPMEIARGGPEYLTVSPNLRASAALAVARFGTKEDVTSLEPLLDDDSSFAVQNGFTVANGPPGMVSTVQVRDAALAAMVHLTGQDLKDYGFTRARANPQTLFEPTSLGLDNNDERTKAIAKWRAWKTAQTSNAAPQR
jgi:hypothetical protein